MNRDFGSLVKQILQTDDCYVHLLEELLVQSGCNVRVELHITGRGNTIVIREQLEHHAKLDKDTYTTTTE